MRSRALRAARMNSGLCIHFVYAKCHRGTLESLVLDSGIGAEKNDASGTVLSGQWPTAYGYLTIK